MPDGLENGKGEKVKNRTVENQYSGQNKGFYQMKRSGSTKGE